MLNLETLLLFEDKGVVELSANVVTVVNHRLEFRNYFLFSLFKQNSVDESPASASIFELHQGLHD